MLDKQKKKKQYFLEPNRCTILPLNSWGEGSGGAKGEHGWAIIFPENSWPIH